MTSKPPSPPTAAPPERAFRPTPKGALDPWRLVIFDTETCPLIRPVVLKNGRSVPNVNNATIVQYAFGDINGEPIVPNTNLDPQVSNWTDLVGYTTYVENAWGVEAGQLPIEAKRLPTFEQSIMASIYTLRTKVSRRLIIAAHNGFHWDFPIWRRQMMQKNLKFPDDMEIITLDTQYITKECVKRVNKYDKKWALGYAHQKLFGREIENQHTAEGDVKALSRVIRHWGAPYCTDKLTEADLIATLFRNNISGLSRSELSGLFHPVVLPAAPGGPKELHLKEEKKEKKAFAAPVVDQVIGDTPQETADRLKLLNPVAKRSLLVTLTGLSKQ